MTSPTTTKFSTIKRPETPERRASIDAHKRAGAVAIALSELRSGRKVTQVEIARRMGLSQGNVSTLERRDDVYLSTLRGYIEALGGSLELVAMFPDSDPVQVAIGPQIEPIAGIIRGPLEDLELV